MQKTILTKVGELTGKLMESMAETLKDCSDFIMQKIVNERLKN